MKFLRKEAITQSHAGEKFRAKTVLNAYEVRTGQSSLITDVERKYILRY
jgi:hypothetical protein